jgi:hypothetical protein
MHRRSRSRGRGRKKSYRGGAGAANPSSYSSAATFMEQTLGNANAQYNRVFDIAGPDGSRQSNAIVGIQGQRAGRRRRRSNKRGGSFVTDAIVPAAFLAGTYLYSRRRGKPGYSKKRSFRRRR